MGKFWQSSQGNWKYLAINQYLENWTSKIINDVLQKIIRNHQLKNGGEKVQLRGQKMPAKRVKTLFFLQYRGNISVQFKQKLEKKRAIWQPYSQRENNLLAYHPWNLLLIAIWSLMWPTNWIFLDVVQPMSDKRVDIWQREFLNIKKINHRWDKM